MGTGYGGVSRGSRSLALTLTVTIHALVACAVLAKWGYDELMVAEPAAPVNTFDIPAAPPDPMREVPDGPEQVEQKEQKPENREKPKIELPKPVLPPVVTQPAPPPIEPVASADPVPQTTAPKTQEAPSANHMASAVKASWQSLLLAHLEKYRRYPASAKARREEGVALVRFTMDRWGRLLASKLVRSSGSQKLDMAALATIKRAAPFPKPPESITGSVIELTVPVEFFVR